MRLLTHNLLICNRRNCSGGFPLNIELDPHGQNTTAIIPTEMNIPFIKNVISKLNWEALVSSSEKLGILLPMSYTLDDLNEGYFLTAVHEAIMEYHILEGNMTCPECKRTYPISKGIPNMLLHEDEIAD